VDRRAVGLAFADLLECWRLHELPLTAFIPGAARVDLAMVASAGGIVEELINQARRWRYSTDAERRLAHAFQGRGERLHVGDFARHQELQRILGAGIVAEIDQPLIHDLRAGFGGDVAAQIDIEFPGDLEIIRRPGIALRIEQVDTAPACDRNKRVGLGRVTFEFRGSEMHAGESAHNFEVAQFLGPDVHEEIFALRVVAVEPLDRVLHRGRELAVGAAELLQQHVAESGIRRIDTHRVHELLDVMVHIYPSSWVANCGWKAVRFDKSGRERMFRQPANIGRRACVF
jgi:hypothetical protein